MCGDPPSLPGTHRTFSMQGEDFRADVAPHSSSSPPFCAGRTDPGEIWFRSPCSESTEGCVNGPAAEGAAARAAALHRALGDAEKLRRVGDAVFEHVHEHERDLLIAR